MICPKEKMEFCNLKNGYVSPNFCRLSCKGNPQKQEPDEISIALGICQTCEENGEKINLGCKVSPCGIKAQRIGACPFGKWDIMNTGKRP